MSKSNADLWLAELPALPRDGSLAVVEETDERLLIYVHAGNRHARRVARALRILFVPFLVITNPIVMEICRQRLPPPLSRAPTMVLAALCWAIYAAGVVNWIRWRFERMILLIEPGRFTVQRDLFGWKRLKDLDLDGRSRASLVESYQGRRMPIYVVEVVGAGKRLQVGRLLEDDEKRWLVRRINSFLGVDSKITAADELPRGLRESLGPPDRGHSRPLPALLGPSGILVVESTERRLVLHVPGGGPHVGIPEGALFLWATVLLGLGIVAWGAFGTRLAAIPLLLGLALLWRGMARWVVEYYPSTLVRLEPGRVIIERTLFAGSLFAWKRCQSVTVDATFCASLATTPGRRDGLIAGTLNAWIGDDKGLPEDGDSRVEVCGRERTLSFGTALSTPEQEWLLDRINDFIRSTNASVG